MIAVIQCAAKKDAGAGHLRERDGRPVLFVARPDEAPLCSSIAYARPDDLTDSGSSWRAQLVQYNESPGNNPLGLLPAWRLYAHPVYELLANRFGPRRVFILSAGWGLIRGDFLTPVYDITFSAGAESYKRRRKKDCYDDFCMLPDDQDEPIVFFGGTDYVGLFCRLSKRVKGQRYMFYRSTIVPTAPGCVLKRFETRTRTNWHYECARVLTDGRISL
jgi:hypothetical protein